MRIMATITFLMVGLLTTHVVIAQSPVVWTYQVTRVQADEFELRFSASIRDGWHIYASKQGETFIGKATSIKLNANPLIQVQGKINEIGDVIRTKEETMGIETNEIRNKVEYVQKVKIKSSAKTSLSGQIEYQSCTNETCLPPTKIDFSLILNEQ